MANPTLNHEALRDHPEGGRGRLGRTGRAGALRGHRWSAPADARRAHDRQRRVRQDVRAVPVRAGRRRVRMVADDALSSTNQIEHPLVDVDRALRRLRPRHGVRLQAEDVAVPRTALRDRSKASSLGAISKAFEIQWDGIVFQAILATVGVFFATLALYVFGVVKVTRRFQMMVIGATFGIFLLYIFGALLSLFGVDVMFWNQPSALGIIVSVVICVRRVAEPVPRLRVHPPGVDQRRAEVHGVVRRVRHHGHAGVDLLRDAAVALAAAS